MIPESILERATGPRSRVEFCKTVHCPWCGAEIEGDKICYLDPGATLTCDHCHKESARGPLTKSEARTEGPSLIGLISPTDFRYLAWRKEREAAR